MPLPGAHDHLSLIPTLMLEPMLERLLPSSKPLISVQTYLLAEPMQNSTASEFRKSDFQASRPLWERQHKNMGTGMSTKKYFTNGKERFWAMLFGKLTLLEEKTMINLSEKNVIVRLFQLPWKRGTWTIQYCRFV